LPVLEDEEPDLPGAPKERGEMGFLDHLEELRMVLLKSFAAVAICMCVVFVFFEKFFALLRYPLERAIGADKASTMLTLMAPMSIITILIQVTLYGGLLLALPVIAYFVGCFIAPALTPREKSILRPGLLAALALFAMGAFGCFFLLLPFGLRFSYNLSQTLHMNNMWNAADYYRMVTLTTLATGLIFEFPLILVILQVLGVIETATLRRHRRYAIMIILVVGGLIAPSPDVSSMLMVSVPMQLLYEASIIVGERLRRRRLAAEAAEAAAEAARFSDAG
jgi:sec-independent protein translocase protein TatC